MIQEYNRKDAISNTRRYSYSGLLTTSTSHCCTMLLFMFWVGTMVTGTLGLAPRDEDQIRQLQTDIDQGRSLDETFTLFKQIFNRSYEDDYEETTRRKIFEVNIQYIKDHNLMYAKGKHSFYLGVNEFADLTHDEFLRYYTGFIAPPPPLANNDNESLCVPQYNDSLPDMVDWREKGLVTKVKNQGQCGSCWAFSTTGSLEGQHKKKTEKLISLSEQQLVDCSRSYGNTGCNGGLMDLAYVYIGNAGGIEGEVDYPYVGKDLVCKHNKSKSMATVAGYRNLPSGCECSLQQAVARVGPISIAMDANNPSFRFYKGGVYNELRCSSIKLSHAMLVVGYGTSPSDYWLVKNSWGTVWGMSGYILMSRNKNNQCGIASYASFPLV